MANVLAVHSAINSLVTYLRNSYPDPPPGGFACKFRLLSSGEMESIDEAETTITVYLHRVTLNDHMRNKERSHGATQPSLWLDLHFMLTIWTSNAPAELTVLAWAMRQLHQNPVLNAAILSPDGGWDVHDVVQVTPAELTNEEVMRVWDRLKPSYRLSVPYMARVVRIDPDKSVDGQPVVVTDFGYGQQAW
ncbi:MAG: DUF4255 domain-containing protein [Caldilineaceae bacterium]